MKWWYEVNGSEQGNGYIQQIYGIQNRYFWWGGGGSSHISREIDVSRPCVIRNLRKKKGRILCSQKFWFVSEFPLFVAQHRRVTNLGFPQAVLVFPILGTTCLISETEKIAIFPGFSLLYEQHLYLHFSAVIYSHTQHEGRKKNYQCEKT
jgi:hypothetical protein